MRPLPRPLTVAARLTLALTWLVGLVGPLPAAAPVFAEPAATAPAGLAPANDDFADAAVITFPPDYVSTPDLSQATSQTAQGEPYPCTSPDQPSVWYEFTPTETGGFAFDTYGTTITHSLALYTGSSLADLTTLDCTTGPSNGDGAFISTVLSANVTYYVQFALNEADVLKAAGAPQGDPVAVFSAFAPGRVSGTVWDDADGDGAQEGGEPGLPGATVWLLDEDEFVVSFTNTDLDGNYAFPSLPLSTTLSLAFEPPPPGPWLGAPLDAAADNVDSDADPFTGQTITFTLTSAQHLDFDAGFGRPVEISGRAWRDLNSNDVQDPGEPGLKEVLICLESDNPFAAAAAPQGPACYDLTVTAADGSYSFVVPAGSYWLTFGDMAPEFTRAAENVGGDAADSDAQAADGLVPTFTVSLGDVLDFDAGYQTTGFGDRVWRDLNYNGVQDPGEPGLAGVTVELYDNNGVVTGAVTDVDGYYAFYNLTPGEDYAAYFYLPPDNDYTGQDAGGDDDLDSDVDISTGRTVTITLSAGELDLSVDAGMTKVAFIVDNLNEYPDTTPGDGLCNDTTSVADAPYGECSLRAAIEEANADADFDVIMFNGTVFSVTQTINQTSAYTVTTSMWVQGLGREFVILDGQNLTRQFLITGYDTDVRLSGLRLEDGNSEYDPSDNNGGAILNESANLTLTDVDIDGAYASGVGGGLYNGQNAALTNVTISGSTGNEGGGIFNRGMLSASALLLENNTAYAGGGLTNNGQVVLVTGDITGNVATDGDGGGVLNFGELTLDDTSVRHNTAAWNGGGIASASYDRVTGIAAPCQSIADCGPSYGRAITLTNTTFVSYNLAGAPDEDPAYGGGIYNGTGMRLLVDDSEVFSNTVYGYGGGIYNAGEASIKLAGGGLDPCYDCVAVTTLQSDSELYLNVALSTTVIYGDPVVTDTYPSLGGGLFNAGLAFVDASELWSNTANQGGGFYNAMAAEICECGSGYLPALFVVNNSQVTSNLARLEGDTEFGFLFSDGIATGVGGGGFNAGRAQVVDSQINSNAAGLIGGGLFNGLVDEFLTRSGQGLGFLFMGWLPHLEVTRSMIASNDADPLNLSLGSGGGVMNLLGKTAVDDSQVIYNYASTVGGGLANGCVFCFLAGQTAGAEPQGPLYLLILAHLTVRNGSEVSHNIAGTSSLYEAGGGGLINTGFAVIADSAVTTNTTAGFGAGLLNMLYLTIDNTAVDANVAAYDGGGIYNTPIFNIAQTAALKPAGPLDEFLFDLPPDLSVEAPLVIRNNSTVSNNRTTDSGDGGGLWTNGPALITDSVIDGNWATNNGGGIAVGRILQSASQTFTGQAANALACLSGSGLFGDINDRVLLNNSTVSNNLAGQVLGVSAPQGLGPQGVGGGVIVQDNDECEPLVFEANQSLLDSNGAPAGGGGIYVNEGVAYLHDTHLLNNDGDSDNDGSGNGGASYNNNGYLLIDPANVIGNVAAYGAGGYYDSGTTLITQTTFATNTATVFGGGLVVSGTAEVTVGNSTFSANHANSSGGALYQQDDTTSLTLANVTIANNTVGAPGVSVAGAGTAGYLRTGTGPAVINNTLIYGNGGPANDCTFTSPATNVTGVANMGDSTCSFIPGWTTDDPELGPLMYNGGPNGILTHALASTSPAIDQADTGVCAASPVFGVDERNLPRLLDLACDIGAYEFETLTAIELVSFTATAQGEQVTLAWETALEIDTAGYNLYRAAAPGGPYVQVNAQLIAAAGPQGGSYSFPDAPGVGTWYYRLEDVSTSGQHTLHGPAVVTVGSGSTASYTIYLPVVNN